MLENYQIESYLKSYNYLQMICIKNRYLKLKLFTKDYHQIEIVTWNHISISIIQEYLKPSKCFYKRPIWALNNVL